MAATAVSNITGEATKQSMLSFFGEMDCFAELLEN